MGMESLLGGDRLAFSIVSTDSVELEVEQPILACASSSTTEPLIPEAFVDSREPSQQLRAISAFDCQRLNCAFGLLTKFFALC